MQPTFNLSREQTTQLYAVEGSNFGVYFHFHSHIELLVVTDGCVEVTVNDQQKLLRAGEIAVALSYDAHQFRTEQESHGISIIIPTDMCPEFISAVGDRANTNPFLCDPELFDTVCRCYQHIRSAPNSLWEKGLVYLSLGAILKHMQLEKKEEASDHNLLTALLMYLSKHYTQEISLETIAADMGYNASYLSRCFNASLHIGIPGYITMLRLRHAVLLMRDPKKSITECAFESGFSSLRTFYRTFREEFHCSPNEYRKQQV